MRDIALARDDDARASSTRQVADRPGPGPRRPANADLPPPGQQERSVRSGFSVGVWPKHGSIYATSRAPTRIVWGSDALRPRKMTRSALSGHSSNGRRAAVSQPLSEGIRSAQTVSVKRGSIAASAGVGPVGSVRAGVAARVVASRTTNDQGRDALPHCASSCSVP